MATMYPQTPDASDPSLSTADRHGRDAERAVYFALDDALPDDVTVIAGATVADPGTRGKPRRLEVDFLLLSPGRPAIALECKAGDAGTIARIADRIGDQFDRNRYGMGRALAQIPGLPESIRHGIGAGLITPNAPAAAAGTDASHLTSIPGLAIGMEHLASPRSLLEAIEGLWAWWEGQRDELPAIAPGNAAPVPPALAAAEIERIVGAIAPTRTGSPLRLMTHNAGSRQHVLTEKQEEALRFVQQRRAVLVGGAGTGKTLVARTRARNAATAGERVLLLCQSRPLASWLGRQLADVDGELDIHTFAELERDLSRDDFAPALAPLVERPPASAHTAPSRAKYDLVIVDEAQDAAPERLAGIADYLADPDDGSVLLLWDEHQALYRERATIPPAFPDDCWAPLTINLRNTRDIHDLADRFRVPGTWGAPDPDGPFIGLQPLAPGQGVAEATDLLVRQAIELADLEPSEIAVLAASDIDGFRDAFAGWDRLGGQRIGRDAAAWDEGDDAVLVDSARRFRGLECSLAIVTGLGGLLDAAAPWRDDVLYTALTRGRTWVVLLDDAASLDRFARLAAERHPDDGALRIYRCATCAMLALSAAVEQDCHRCGAGVMRPIESVAAGSASPAEHDPLRSTALRAGQAIRRSVDLRTVERRPSAPGAPDIGLAYGLLRREPVLMRIRTDGLRARPRLRETQPTVSGASKPWLEAFFGPAALMFTESQRPTISVGPRPDDEGLGQFPSLLLREIAALAQEAGRINARWSVLVFAGPQDDRGALSAAMALLGRGPRAPRVVQTAQGAIVAGPAGLRTMTGRQQHLWIVALPPDGA